VAALTAAALISVLVNPVAALYLLTADEGTTPATVAPEAT
jgi:hypothetical protein